MARPKGRGGDAPVPILAETVAREMTRAASAMQELRRIALAEEDTYDRPNTSLCINDACEARDAAGETVCWACGGPMSQIIDPRKFPCPTAPVDPRIRLAYLAEGLISDD